MTSVLSPKDIDLNNLELFKEEKAHELLKLLRTEDPVHWNEGTERNNGFWSITRYEDILFVSRHPEIFSSARGIAGPGLRPEFIEQMMARPPPARPRTRATSQSSPWIPRAI
ncbi:MAG: hypothetical protein AB7N24_04815 [Dehalococcoidia bacterium]